MLKIFFIYGYLFLYFLSLGYTHPVALERLTYSDILLLPIIIIALSKVLLKRRLFLAPVHKIYIIFLLLLFVSTAITFFKMSNDKALFEYIVHIFSFLIFFSFYQLYFDAPHEKKIILANIWFYAVGMISLLALIDFTLIPIFPHEINAGGLVGGFRNTGQAGTFISISIILGFSLYVSGFIKSKYIAYFFFLTLVISLILTVKRAALLGVVISFILLVLLGNTSSKNAMLSRLSLVTILLMVSMAGYFSFEWALENVDGLAWRFEYKVTSYGESTQSDFLFEQIDKSFLVFLQSPIIGVGLGGAQDILGSSHEIHNGYLKILVGSGLIGFSVFLLFYLKIFFDLKSVSKKNIALKKFSSTLFPMLMGLSISWGYSYPLRKREFWILLAITFILISTKRLRNKK